MSQVELNNVSETVAEDPNPAPVDEVAVPDLSASNDALEEGGETVVAEDNDFVISNETEEIDPNTPVFNADDWQPAATTAGGEIQEDAKSEINYGANAGEEIPDAIVVPKSNVPSPLPTDEKEPISLVAMLDDTIGGFNSSITDLSILREGSQMNVLNHVEKAEGVVDATGFPAVIFSDDSVTRLSNQMLHSPKIPPSDYVFISADYSADPDVLDLTIGAPPMTRSGSLDSLVFDPKTIFFDRTDEYKEYPRTETPTKSSEKLDGDAQVPLLDPIDGIPDGGETQGEAIPEQQQAVAVVEQEVKIDRDAIIQSILKHLELKDRLTARNVQLQNKLADYFKRKRIDESRDTEKSMTDQEQRYQNVMNQLTELHDEAESIKVTNKKIASDYQQKLNEKLSEVNEKAEGFWEYKRTVALNAENSRTGKSLPDKVVEQLEATERKKENEVVNVRLENIKLRNKLKRQEALLRQKEELADGLHLIDFEQLKIENQTYNEKIEERNEELLKLRKKITNIVQVLTHVKEKLQFIQAETVDLKTKLKTLDEKVTSKRDSLPSLKSSRDKLKSTNSLLRQQNGLLGNEKLLMDYGENVDEAKLLKARISDLQEQHSKLLEESTMIRRRIQKVQLIAKLRAEGPTSNAQPPLAEMKMY